jgi:hypothetical protein
MTRTLAEWPPTNTDARAAAPKAALAALTGCPAVSEARLDALERLSPDRFRALDAALHFSHCRGGGADPSPSATASGMPPATTLRRRAANRMRAVPRDPEMLDGFGGDEFVIVMAEPRTTRGDLSARVSSRQLVAALYPAKRVRREATRT